MLSVYDLAIVFIIKRILSKLALCFPDKVLHQLSSCFLVDQNVVGSYTGLATVQELSKDDSPGSKRNICVLLHNYWRLSSQLQGHRSEMAGSLFHYKLSYVFASCEEDEVELLI